MVLVQGICCKIVNRVNQFRSFDNNQPSPAGGFFRRPEQHPSHAPDAGKTDKRTTFLIAGTSSSQPLWVSHPHRPAIPLDK
jgi:hypothetical protein